MTSTAVQHVTATATGLNSPPYARTAAQPGDPTDAVVHNIAQLSCTECGLPRESRRDVGSKDRLQNNSHTTVALLLLLLMRAAACCFLLLFGILSKKTEESASLRKKAL